MHIKRERRDDPQFLVGAAVLGPGIVVGVIRDVVSVDETHELPSTADCGSILIVEVDVRFGFEATFGTLSKAIAPLRAIVGFVEELEAAFARDRDGFREGSPADVEGTDIRFVGFVEEFE